MSWIDTPLVREAKAEFSSFNDLVNSLRGPMNKITSVEECGKAFIEGIEARKSRIYCPGWVGLFRWIRPLVAMRVGERDIRKTAPELIAKMDAEADALGRNFSARTEALEKR